ncbi:MAG: hypothetical protein QXP28_06135 [Archaeoglobaceae archaeon]
MERKGSYEREKGMVEAVIVFTSKETIEGTILNSCQSKWFGFGFNRGDRSYTLESVYMKFFNKLFDYFEEKFGFRPKEFRMFAVEVNHQDFEDCFKKIGTTLNALKDKEIWGSIIGGSNQINIAILTAGAYKATVSRYYYVFQSAQKPSRAGRDRKAEQRKFKRDSMRNDQKMAGTSDLQHRNWRSVEKILLNSNCYISDTLAI